MSKFYNFINKNEKETDLYITGDIITNDEQLMYDWFDIDGVSPKKFKAELENSDGKTLNVIIDSMGGSVVAASVIYSMLMSRKGKTVCKVSGIAASAASVIAVAGNTMLMAPTALFAIHNPFACIEGNSAELKQAAKMLDTVKESVINAYERKTNLSRDKISKFMDEEKFFNVNEAMEYGFCDGVWGDANDAILLDKTVLDSIKNQRIAVFNKINIRPQDKPAEPQKAAGEEVIEQAESAAQAHSDGEIRSLELRKQIALLKRF